MAQADDDALIALAAWTRTAAGEVAGDVIAEMATPLADLRDHLALIVERIDRHVADASGPVPYPWKALQAMRQDLAALYLSSTTMSEMGRELASVVRGLGGPAGAVEVEHVVEAAVSLVRHRIGARTELLVDAGSVPLVLAPQAELTTVVARMIAVCARSADRADTAAMSVRTRGEGDWVVISAVDNGAGAAEETAALGTVLATFTAAHGGSYAATSEPDQGTALELRLPAFR